jgi:HlyD family secretion protein
MSDQKNDIYLLRYLILASAMWAGVGCGPKIKVKSIQTKKTQVESTVNTTSSGTIEAEQQAILGFSTTGRVSRVRVRAGDRVKKGQVLAELENSDLQTISRDAATELSRAQELFQAGLVSKAALDEASKANQVARANLERAVIHAPFDGLITEVHLEVGELPSGVASPQSQAPIRIADLKPRVIRGSVDEVDLAKIKVGAMARIRIPAIRATPYEGEVSRVVPYVSTIKEQDRTSQVEFKLRADQEKIEPLSLPIGASADIEIVVETRPAVLAIPTRALLGTSQARFVFVLNSGKAKQTSVKLGLTNYDRSEIIEGLTEGDSVLLPPDDAELKDGARVRAEETPWP